jgi:flagella basal body P-ring formation protein FlgA
MKTAAKKSFTIFSIFALLILGVSANATASSTEEHDVMATQFENLAKEMQAKVIEQKEIVKHKPRSSYFGKMGKELSHILLIRFANTKKWQRSIWHNRLITMIWLLHKLD